MGPSASVLLREQLDEEDCALLDQTIDRISSRRVGNEFCVNSTKPIGGVIDEFESDAFLLGTHSLRRGEGEYDDAEPEQIERSIGFAPVQFIQVDALFNGSDVHRVLAELSLFLSKSFNGFVDFHGAILPMLPAVPSRVRGAIASSSLNWSDVARYFEHEKNKYPGQLHAIEYQVTAQRSWAYQIGDPEFLQSWLNHPNFHMIK